MKVLASLFWGLVFGAGLSVSGMTNPGKVLAFLDVAGAWDPTLALVMGGALAVSALGYQVARRRDRAWLGDAFAWPTRQDLDASLLGGAALFGVGWGLVGLCPGPALANLSRGSVERGSVERGSVEIVVFVVAMLLGTVATRFALRPRPTAALPKPS